MRDAQNAAADREHEALGQELAHEPVPAGAHGRAHRELLRGGRASGRRGGSRGSARDQQNADGGAEERLQQQPRLVRDLVVQRIDVDARLLVLLRERALEPPRDELHLGAGLLDRDTRLQPRDDGQVRVGPVGERALVAAERRPEVGVAAREEKAARHDADDDVRLAVEEQLPAERRRDRLRTARARGGRSGRPRRRRRPVGRPRPKETAERRRARGARRRAPPSRSRSRPARGSAVADEVRRVVAVRAHPFERGREPLPVAEVARRDVHVRDAARRAGSPRSSPDGPTRGRGADGSGRGR